MTLSKRGRLIAGLGTLAAIAALAVTFFRHDEREGSKDAAAPQSTSASSRTFTFAWPAGRRYAYALSWSSKEDVDLSTGQGAKMHAGGTLALEGRLELRSYGLEESRWLVGARLADVTKHEFVLNGANVLPNDAAVRSVFGEREAIAELGVDGRLRAVWFAKETPPVFRHMMKSLLTELEVVVPPAATLGGGWMLDEETSLGLAHVQYSPSAGGAAGELQRVRTGYAHLTGLSISDTVVASKGFVVLAPEGHLRTLEQHDDVTGDADGGRVLAATLDLRVKLESVTSIDAGGPPSLTDMDRATPGVVETSASSERALLDQQAAGLTLPDLLAALTLARDGNVPGLSRFVWRATGLLARDPEGCDELAKIFRSKSATSQQRALALDLLAGTGTPKAQAAMRDALSSETARTEKNYPTLVQRFSFVEHPDRASGDFVENAYRDAKSRGDDDARYATAYSLGAIAGHLASNGEAAAANTYADELKRDLDRARDPNERAQLLTALGAAGRPQDLPTIGTMSGDADPAVRRAAAGALRSDDSPEGLAILLRLVADPLPPVQQAALRVLGQRALTDATLGVLAAIVERNVLHKSSYGDLLSLLGSRTAAGAPVVRMLVFVVQHSDDDPSMEARARRLLVESGAAPP